MLKNFWYAVEFSDRVTTRPAPITVLGQQLALYRTPSGKIVALSDLCVHRGAALSGGRLKDDCIVCPYHGWEYRPDGQCVKIPAQPDRAVPAKARVDSYPTQERYGFIWVYLGDLPEEERPPMPVWPEFDDLVENGGRFRAVTGEFLWNANYERILENGCDIAHAPFVHAGSFGNPERPEVPDYELEQPDEWSAFATVDLYPPAPRGIWGRFARLRGQDLNNRPPVTTTAGWMLPNLIKLHVRLPIGDLVIYDTNIPIDDTHTLVKWVALRSFFTGGWADRNAIQRTLKIFYQDAEVVDKVRPELLPFDLGAELHIRSDLIAVQYRRRRQELAEKGWLLSAEDVITGDVPRRTATVIASPARRENPELARAWVHKARGEHPTVAASELMGTEEEPK
ncbi:aromatic ring-hydroxylating dioxygenase subunit alpha [Actinoplanes sp. NPDC026623]|uniref:aromatic ring-hydroxylating dioxygenase subunit alpha n=1 Tax=Actinoplanes sp. NPDC026623 TaxID=3155610 RepID=UPI0033F00280